MRHAHMLPQLAGLLIFLAHLPAAPALQVPPHEEDQEEDQKEIEIKPTREAIPEGMVEVRSRFLQIPFAHGQVRSGTGTGETLNAKGHMPLPHLELATTFQVAPTASTEFHAVDAPKLLPESRWLLGDLGTILVPIPEGVETPGAIHLCALTRSEKAIPIAGVDWHKTQDNAWVLHFTETEDLANPQDPVEWLCLRMLAPTEDRVWIQTFGLAELRRSIQKAPVAFHTLHLSVRMGDRAPFGERVEKQTLTRLYPELTPNHLWLKSKALSAWLACPDKALWSKDESGAQTLVLPRAVESLHAYFSGTTCVHLPIDPPPIDRENPTQPFEVSLFAPEGEALTPATEWYEPTDPALQDAIHTSLVWGPTGNLFSGQVLQQELETQMSASPWPLLVPADYLYTWDLRHLVGTDHTYQSFFVSSPTGRDFHGENFNHTARHSLRLRPKTPKLALAERASTDWAGPVTLFLMGQKSRGDQFELFQESFTLEWPEDAGRRLDLQGAAGPYDFWYAVSSTGQGTYGVFGLDPDQSRNATVVLDLSMESGWSAVCVTRWAEWDGDQRAQLVTRSVGPGFTPDTHWQAAAGARVLASGLMDARRLGNRAGVSMLSSPGVPSVLDVEIPGAYKSRTRPPVGAQWFEIQLQR